MKIALIRPVPEKFPITSGISNMREIVVNGVKQKRPHNGIDFECPVGTPIQAVEPGRIARVGWENEFNPKQGYGLRIWQEITLDDVVYMVVYAHLSEVFATEGAKVKRGDTLGLSGNTGASTGPHLHLGARINNTNIFVDMEFPTDANA